MNRILTTLALTVAIVGGAQARDPYAVPGERSSGARGVETFDAENGARVRAGTRCSLTLYGEDIYDGVCNVGRRGRVTIIDTGTKTYKIVRDEFDATEATFYSGGQEIGPVSARGNCWRGRDARYCAN